MASSSISAFAANLPSPVEGISSDIPEQELAKQLESMGYNDVYDVEGAGRFYSARAEYNDVWYQLTIDAKTGEVTSLDDDKYKYVSVVNDLTDDTLVMELQRLGYTNVEIGKSQGSYIEATASRYGEPTNLTIDTQTGRVVDHMQGAARYVPMHDETTTQDVVNYLEQMGYENVREVTTSDGFFKMEAEQAGNTRDILVDADTGEVHQLGSSEPG
jgi:phosphoribosylformylglycinamidine (FGAM) synthase PurS component